MLNLNVELHILCMKEIFEEGQLYIMCLAEFFLVKTGYPPRAAIETNPSSIARFGRVIDYCKLHLFGN